MFQTNVCFSVTGVIPTQKHNLRHCNGNVLVFVTRKENTCDRPKLKPLRPFIPYSFENQTLDYTKRSDTRQATNGYFQNRTIGPRAILFLNFIAEK